MAVEPIRRVILLLEPQIGYDRGVMHGIRRYAGAGRPWLITVRQLAGIDPADVVEAFAHCDGVIARLNHRPLYDLIAPLKTCVVNVSGMIEDLPVPRVSVQNEAVGEVAAKHLLERGFRHFACLRWIDGPNSRRRWEGFAAAVVAAGLPTPAWRFTDGDGSTGQKSIEAWLTDLPKPLGLYTDTDPTGLEALERCRAAGLRVPEQIALVSTDNDELMCDFALPRMSSVDLSARQIGYEAARLLDGLMNGHAPPDRPLLVPPLGVVTRQSSDALAIEDADVAAALRFIRQNYRRPIDVDSIAAEVAVARRSLERRFRVAVGHSMVDEIRRTRVGRAKEMLVTTDLPVAEIAERTGFPSAVRLSVVFQELAGESPRDYRRRLRPVS